MPSPEAASRIVIPNADGLEAHESESAEHRWLVWVSFTGFVLVAFASPIRDIVDGLLPGRATIPSRGVNYPAFAEVGDAIIRRTGFALLISAGVTLARARWTIATPRWMERLTAALVIAGTGLWYGYLGAPHNAFSSNARFHWVDYLTFDDDNFFYAAGRIPHMVFYDHPYIWNGLVATSVSWLLYAIGRQLDLSRSMSIAMALLPAVSGSLLLFSSTAEDLMFNVALCLVAIHASLLRQPVYLGAALALTILGRPSFVILIPCLVGAELFATVRDDHSLRKVNWRYLAIVVGIAGAITVAMQVLFTILGDRYFLVNGEIIDKGPLDDAVPLEVDGFTIHAFSGAYVGHFVWMVPAVFLIGATATIVASRRLLLRVDRTVVFSALAVVGLLFVHESQPLNNYAQRYLTYTLPFLVVMSWAWLSPRQAGAGERWMYRSPSTDLRRFVAVLLVIGSTVIPASPLAERSERANRDENELLEIQHTLRDLAQGREVYFGGGSRSSRNYMAYVLKTGRDRFQQIGEWPNMDVEDGALVVIRRAQAPEVEPLLETDTWIVFIAGAQDSQ